MPYSDDLIKNSHDTREDEDDEDDNDRLDVVGLDESLEVHSITVVAETHGGNIFVKK